ncbi:MAG: hypothetical protein V3575_05980 [Candidatus Absconditabacteria bacterium]
MQNEFSVKTSRKNGNETFSLNSNTLEFNILDFWSWSSSDLLNNTMRGILAEFIIAKALGIDNSYRVEWNEYDLVYDDLKIEVKSGAYIQSWEQQKFSNIVLTIKPTKDQKCTNCKRQSDIYIFAILSHKDSKTINPLNLEQWDFYIIKTSILNEKLGEQKTIVLNGLLNLNPIKSSFENLKNNIDSINI